MNKIKINQIEGHLSFKQLQEQFQNIANTFAELDDEIEIENISSWLMSAMKKLQSFRSLGDLAESYICQIKREQILRS